METLWWLVKSLLGGVILWSFHTVFSVLVFLNHLLLWDNNHIYFSIFRSIIWLMVIATWTSEKNLLDELHPKNWKELRDKIFTWFGKAKESLLDWLQQTNPRKIAGCMFLALINLILRTAYFLPFVKRERKRFDKENKPLLRFKTWRSFTLMGSIASVAVLMIVNYLTGIIRSLLHFIVTDSGKTIGATLHHKNYTSNFNWNSLLWYHLLDFQNYKVAPILAIPLAVLGLWVVWKSSLINWEKYRDYNNSESGDDRFVTLKELKKQYYKVPDKAKFYPGENIIPLVHLNGFSLQGWTLGTLMRYRDKKTTDFLLKLLKLAGIKKRMTGFYLGAKEMVNVLVNGTTRSGKGESLVNPIIELNSRAQTPSSLVTLDPKGELYQASYKLLTERGFNVEVLSFQDMDWSMSYNPLALAIEAAQQGYYEKVQIRLQAVAEAIYRKSKGGFTKGNQKYFEDTSIALFNAITLALIDRANEASNSGEDDAWDTVTIRNVVTFLNTLASESLIVDGNGNVVKNENAKENQQREKQLKLYFDELRKINQERYSKFREMADINYRTIDFSGGETQGNVLSSMLSGIVLFFQDNVARLTSKNSLDLETVGNPRRLRIHFRSTRKPGIKNLFAFQEAKISIFSTYLGGQKRRYYVKNVVTLLDELGVLNFVVDKKLPNHFMIEVTFGSEDNNVEIQRAYLLLDGEKVFAERVGESEKSGLGLSNRTQVKKEVTGVKLQIKQGMYNSTRNEKLPIDHRDFQFKYSEKPTALFIVIPPNRSEYANIATLLIDQLFQANYEVALSAGRKTTNRILFVLDEFGNMPPIPKIAEKLNIGLGQNMQFVLFIQELSQLTDKYGKEAAEAIMGACSLNMLIKTATNTTAKFYSSQLGSRTITSRTKTSSLLNEANVNVNTTEREQPLMTPTQLKNLQAGEMVIIRGVKTADRGGRKVVPDPIFAHGRTEMPYRYMFLGDEMNQSYRLSDIPVKSEHRGLDLRSIALDNQDVYRQIKEWRESLVLKESAKLQPRKRLTKKRVG